MVLQYSFACRKTTVVNTFFFWPQGAPLHSSLLEDRDRRSHAACHVRGCDRSSQHQAQHLGRRQSYGYVERGKTPEGAVLASLSWKSRRLPSLSAFPHTNRILLAHVKQNGVIPSTKEVRVMSARTILISGNALNACLCFWNSCMLELSCPPPPSCTPKCSCGLLVKIVSQA